MAKLSRSIILPVILATLLSASSLAQTTLTLAQCYDLAGKNSLRLRQADIAVRKGNLFRSQLATTGKPTVRLDAGASYAPYSADFGYDPGASNGGQLNGQMVVEQSIYDGGARRLRTQQLTLEIERLGVVKRSIQRDLRFQVRLAFVEMLRAQQEAGLRKESVRRLTEYFDLVNQLARGGGAGYTDLLKTRVELTNDSLELQKAAESLITATYQLADLIGTAADTTFILVGSLDSLGGTAMASSAVGSALDTVSNLDIHISDLSAQSSKYDLELMRRGRYPVVSAFADAGLLTTGENLRLPAAERASMLGYSAGVSFQFPLFGWGAIGLQEQQQELVTDSLRLETSALRRSLALEIRNARLRLTNEAKRLQSIRANIQRAGENYLLTKAKYASGNTLSLEVLSAQQLLTEAKLTELETLAEMQTLSAELEKLTTQ